MLTLKEVRKWIAGLGVTSDDNVYIGKLDNKQQKSIGVYSRSVSGKPNIAIGGIDCTTYMEKPVSLLIHWNKSKDETEKAAYALFDKLLNTSSLYINGIHVSHLRLMVPEPQDIGTDESGVYEYVIWLDFIFQRERG